MKEVDRWPPGTWPGHRRDELVLRAHADRSGALGALHAGPCFASLRPFSRRIGFWTLTSPRRPCQRRLHVAPRAASDRRPRRGADAVHSGGRALGADRGCSGRDRRARRRRRHRRREDRSSRGARALYRRRRAGDCARGARWARVAPGNLRRCERGPRERRAGRRPRRQARARRRDARSLRASARLRVDRRPDGQRRVAQPRLCARDADPAQPPIRRSLRRPGVRCPRRPARPVELRHGLRRGRGRQPIAAGAIARHRDRASSARLGVTPQPLREIRGCSGSALRAMCRASRGGCLLPGAARDRGVAGRGTTS